jgi:hypothetical protein
MTGIYAPYAVRQQTEIEKQTYEQIRSGCKALLQAIKDWAESKKNAQLKGGNAKE